MRLIRLLALSLLTVLVFSACSPVIPQAPTFVQNQSTLTPTPGPISSITSTDTLTPTSTYLPSLGVDPAQLRGLNLQVWDAFAGTDGNLFTRLVGEFNANNEWGITVNPTSYGDYTSLFETMNAALDSGQSPDLVGALPEQALAWDGRDVVVDLNAYLSDPQWSLGSEAEADIPAIFLAQDNLQGRQLGLPAERSARFMFYNLTWAHELGFSSPPASAEDFRKQACAANASFRKDADPKNDGYGGWIVDAAWQTTYSWMLAFGGGVADGDAYVFRTDPNLAVLQFEKDLIDNHCAWLSTEPTPFDSFARRSALFISADLASVPAEVESMKRLKNSDAWTVLPFSGPLGSVVVPYGPSYYILKTTPERQLAAWVFLRWLLSPENQSQWVEATGLFPLRNSVMAMIQPYRQASPQWEAAVAALPLAQGVPQLASWRKVRYVLEDGMTVLFLTNPAADKLPAVLTEMDAMVQELK